MGKGHIEFFCKKTNYLTLILETISAALAMSPQSHWRPPDKAR